MDFFFLLILLLWTWQKCLHIEVLVGWEIKVTCFAYKLNATDLPSPRFISHIIYKIQYRDASKIGFLNGFIRHFNRTYGKSFCFFLILITNHRFLSGFQMKRWIIKSPTLNIMCRNILTEKTDLSRKYLQSLKTFCVQLICNVAWLY